MRNARPSHKPDGVLAIVEWLPRDRRSTRDGSPEQVESQLKAAGYKLERTDPLLEANRNDDLYIPSRQESNPKNKITADNTYRGGWIDGLAHGVYEPGGLATALDAALGRFFAVCRRRGYDFIRRKKVCSVSLSQE